jgi:ABC-type branched-subunit amino acid transport system ATPase component
MSSGLRLQHVHSSYDKREIVRGVSLEVWEGETLGIVGPNGAGKSTLLRLIAGLMSLDEGEIFLHEQDISTLPPHERARRGVGYLMQGGRTFPSLSVAENLAIGALILPKQERRKTVSAIAEMLGLKNDLKKPVAILSGGQRQRLSMAVVLAGKPSVLLLDEPSSGVSPAFVKGAFRGLAQYQELHKTSILLVEQHLSSVIDFAKRAIVMVDGRIKAETKAPQDLLSKDLIDSLFWSNPEMPAFA